MPFIIVKREPIRINDTYYVDNVMSHAFEEMCEARRFMLEKGWRKDCKVIPAYPIQMRWYIK